MPHPDRPPGETRLEASIDQHSAIWVNGDKFELGPEAVGHAESLQRAWCELRSTLDIWHTSKFQSGSTPKVTRVEMAERPASCLCACASASAPLHSSVERVWGGQLRASSLEVRPGC